MNNEIKASFAKLIDTDRTKPAQSHIYLMSTIIGQRDTDTDRVAS